MIVKSIASLAVLAGALVLSGASYAADSMHYNAEGMRHAAHQPIALHGPFTTKAKVAYGYFRGFVPDRSKNVSDFQHPAVGIYCILPSIAVDVSQDTPQTGIEWATSLGFGLWAYWVDVNSFTECPSGYLEVKTYDLESGNAVASDNIAFNMVLE